MEWKKPKLPEYALQRIKKSQEELIERSEQRLRLTQRGFRLSYLIPETVGVIFDSEWCRVRIGLFHPGPSPRDDELYFSYGRLHAPNDKSYMEWNGEQCHCWHNSHYLLLFFLEGYAPSDAVGKSWDSAPVIGTYWRSEEGSQLRRDERAEFVFKLEALIWERYGQRLFELFDLRRPELWEQYRQFLKELYEHKNWQPESAERGWIPRPAPWLVC